MFHARRDETVYVVSDGSINPLDDLDVPLFRGSKAALSMLVDSNEKKKKKKKGK